METKTFSINHLFDFFTEKSQIISIIGMDKNVGKTTLLNFLLKELQNRHVPTLVLSIGRDGEANDSVENTSKPPIIIYKGGCFLTIKELIRTPSSIEILECFNSKVSGSKIILGHALQDTQIQLVNPANQKVLSEMIRISLERCGGGTVFIDGALDRLSHGSSSLIDGVFVCAGVQSEGDLSEIIKKTRLLISHLQNEVCDKKIKQLILKQALEKGTLLIRNEEIIDCIQGTLIDTTDLDEKIKNNDIIYTTGVITDKIINRFIEREQIITMVLIDGTKAHISQRYCAIMHRMGIRLQIINRIPVYGLSINSVGIRRSMNPSKVLKCFREAFKGIHVFDTTYLE